MRHVSEDISQLRELALAAGTIVRQKIAGNDNNLRLQGAEPSQRADDVFIAHPRPDVQIADEREGGAVQAAGKIGYHEISPHELQPLRLDPKGVARDSSRRRGERASPTQEKCSAVQSQSVIAGTEKGQVANEATRSGTQTPSMIAMLRICI